jgi:polysaccharide biosynthesis protein PslG
VLLVILACLVLCPAQASSKNALAAPGPLLGFHIAEGDAAHFAAAEAAGGRFVVIVFSWRDIQPTPDSFYWEVPDAALRAAAFYGLEVVARLDRPPDWARTDGGPAPWDLDAYANFTRQVALRYGARLAGAIIWNEPNLALEWNGRTPDAAAYAAMLKAAYTAVKETAPGLPVAAAGLALTRGDGQAAAGDLDYLQQLYAAGAGPYFDVLAAHPYGFGQPPNQPPAPDRLNFRRLELQRAIMAANGDSRKPVWITEMGWRTRAPAAERWQVVTPEQQRDYTINALEWAARYPWLQRMALWELTRPPDTYGYALWQGPGQTTPAYRALVARQATAGTADETLMGNDAGAPVEILAPDVIVRLGDRGELHPHWVHLHRSGELFSPDWKGEFFVHKSQLGREYELVLETMQVDQPTNRIVINGTPLDLLQPRTRLDPTSTWATQRLLIPTGVLRAGVNEITVASGLRLPVRQYAWWRWENFQFRNIRLAPRFVFPLATIRWETPYEDMPTEQGEAAQPEAMQGGQGRGAPLSSPSGWAETNRVRIMAESGGLWLTANRSGQVWPLDTLQGSEVATLLAQADGAAEHVFRDVAETGSADDRADASTDASTDGHRQVTATDRGLLWRRGDGRWAPVEGAPAAPANVVIHQAGAWYAGFEQRGVWAASAPQGPWQPAGLEGRTVLDLAALDGSTLYAASDDGVYRRQGDGWRRLRALPASESAANANFVPRLWMGTRGEVAARSEDRLFVLDPEAGSAWQPLGPEELQGRILTAIGCCGEGMLVGTNGKGLWQQVDGGWQRVDDGYFEHLEITDGVAAGEKLYVGTGNGLFAAGLAGGTPHAWRKVAGLPATVTDLLVAPQDPLLWVAATPAGVYRSPDGGQTWEAISPPWVVCDLAWSRDGLLWAALSSGIASADAAGAGNVTWRTAGGMQTVTFFTVSPDPQRNSSLWAGSWGNDIGSSDDGGSTLQPLHNGLETLSVLTILRHVTPGQFTIGTIEGLYRSDDGGASWFKLPGALAQQTVYGLYQAPGGVIWAGASGGLWRSDDYGASWHRIGDLPAATVVRVGELAHTGGTLLWAGTEGSGLWLSGDAGKTWQYAGLPGRTVYALIATPGGQIVAATDVGLFREG